MFQPACKLQLGNVEIYNAPCNINVDLISLANQGNRAAVLRWAVLL